MDFKTRQKLLKDDAFLKKTAHLTNDELAPMLGLSPLSLRRHRKVIHHAIAGDGAPQKGNVGEKIASALLHANGVANELMPCNHPFDILALDRVRLDVKIANKPVASPSMKNYISAIWRFNVRRDKRDDADFYLCVITPTEEAFVIPANEVPRDAREIRFCWPTSRPSLSKWQHYFDAYDLIFEFAERLRHDSLSQLITAK